MRHSLLHCDSYYVFKICVKLLAHIRAEVHLGLLVATFSSLLLTGFHFDGIVTITLTKPHDQFLQSPKGAAGTENSSDFCFCYSAFWC